jgi:glycosyltransferase involved in cell wall biosynthesis
MPVKILLGLLVLFLGRRLFWLFVGVVGFGLGVNVGRYHRTRNLVSGRRVEVIHNFVDHTRFTAVGAAAGAAMRAQLGIDPTAPLIGTIGAVVAEKGLAHLIEALAQVRSSLPQARLLIVGDGPDGHAAALHAAARRLGVDGAIVRAGPRPDVPEVLAALDVFVSASLEENLPLSVLKAMAAGVAVVATAVGGVPECVSDGETGLLVPPAAGRALAAAIVEMLRDRALRRRLGSAGQRRVRERFAPETQVPRIEAALSRAVTPGGPPA